MAEVTPADSAQVWLAPSTRVSVLIAKFAPVAAIPPPLICRLCAALLVMVTVALPVNCREPAIYELEMLVVTAGPLVGKQMFWPLVGATAGFQLLAVNQSLFAPLPVQLLSQG